VWDSFSEEDEIGEDIFTWCMENNVLIANNGKHTFVAKENVKISTPDITMYSAGLEVNKWNTMRSFSSDHLPISFSVCLPIVERERVRNIIKQTKYAFKKADWRMYNDKVRTLLVKYELVDENNIHERSKRLTRCLEEAGSVIPRGCRTDPVKWWHKDIDAAIEIREECAIIAARSESDRLEWIEAGRNVRKIIAEKTEESWKEFASTLRYNSCPSKTAKIINGINREQRPAESISVRSMNGKLLVSDMDKAIAFRGIYSKVCSNTGVKRTDEEKNLRRGRINKAENRRMNIEVSNYCNSKDNSV
jgi:hypothetical protein